MKAKGKVFKYGNNIDTDVIFPARYLTLNKPEELAAHAMEDLDPAFVKTVKPGDVVVAGSNFGCGSCRDHAVMAMKEIGVSCVIAKSFSRMFYRNSINIGLPLMECPLGAEEIADGDQIEINFSEGRIYDITTGKAYDTAPFPPFIQSIIDAGGIIEFTRKEVGE